MLKLDLAVTMHHSTTISLRKRQRVGGRGVIPLRLLGEEGREGLGSRLTMTYTRARARALSTPPPPFPIHRQTDTDRQTYTYTCTLTHAYAHTNTPAT